MSLQHEPTVLNSKSQTLEEDVIQLCTKVVPKWNIIDTTFSVSPIEGGITNLLLKVTNNQRSVTVRIFGDNTDLIIDRERELRNLLQITGQGFGATVLATFENGRVEEYLEAYTLTPGDLRDSLLSGKIAQKLWEFHNVQVEETKKPVLWETISKWLQLAEKLSFPESIEKQQQYDNLNFEYMRRELDWTLKLCEKCQSPVVYCHNDLLCGNILIKNQNKKCNDNIKDGELQFIDFEYGCYSHRGFDWGNHFNEWAGFDCDFSLYPNKQQQINFLQHYFKNYTEHNCNNNGFILDRSCSSENDSENSNDGKSNIQNTQDDKYNCCNSTIITITNNNINKGNCTKDEQNGSDNSTKQCNSINRLRQNIIKSNCNNNDDINNGNVCLQQSNIERYLAEAGAFSLASHIYWGVWAILQAKYSPIEFDYLEYSKLRWEQYRINKQEVESLVICQFCS
eukprot:TRINITY_DN9166_c0_g2_i3.p1 TRINITY_DN9166_c0_g2~~TRINITY_DN9166_c0_g2_i3.p1  ORF type:complete len:453 (+),score=23.57 TRINITY_DN9166_c0_g2_i3:138-1496(+)